jgi:uncharacterized protein (DUF488 family)
MLRQKILINHRQKILIGLLRLFGNCLSGRSFQKYLFLYTQEFQGAPSYDFIPYKYGCFSFQSYADKRRLTEIGLLASSEDWQFASNIEILALISNESLPFEDKFYTKYSHLKGDNLVRYVYRIYPYYAIKSEIASRLMNQEELSVINNARPAAEEACFFTIGYEGSSLDGYLNRLIRNNIQTLVDVRHNPLSRKYGFSKKTLSESLGKMGIEYIHIPELGIASDKRQHLETQQDYNHLLDDYERNNLTKNAPALQKLFDIFLDRKRIAVTCFEGHASMCHRGRVAKALSQRPDWNFEVEHI